MRIEPRQAQVYERKDMVVLKPASKPLPAAVASPAAPAPGIPWDKAQEATGGCCMWPLWGLDQTKGNVCGQERHLLHKGTKREKASSYCEAHHRRAYHQTTR